MPLPVRRSSRRGRRKGPDEEERAVDCLAEVMAPTRMKLRGRRRDAPPAAAPAGGAAVEGEAERPRESRRSSRRKAATKASAPTDPAPSSASPPTTSSGTVRPAMAAEASPDSKCPICLDRFNNLAYLDHCLHRFCFPCIQEWSHNKPECPLCKQPFASILHSVRAEDDFKEYTLQPPRAANPLTASTFLTTVAAMTSDGSTQHHLRLMLRRHLVAADREALRRRRRRERASGRRSNDRIGEWEVFMHSPPLPLSPYHLDMSELIMENMGVEEEFRRRDEEQRLVFNELTGLRGPAAQSARVSRRLMCRLAVRQRLQREGGVIQMSEREVLAFRKALYQCGIRVRGGSRNPWRQRSISAESFRRSSSHLSRLQSWLRRELRLLLGSHSSLADMVQRTVTGRALRSGLEDSTVLEEELRPFLLARTEHFVHELVNFARSPLAMESYDQQAVYEPPSTTMELDQISTSSDGSSVIAISEGEDEGGAGGGRSEGAAGGGNEDVTRTGSSLSLSGWDDETPGPSYTSAEPSHSLTSPPDISPTPQEPANQETGEGRPEEEECLIVGYKKPIAERTPELVQLSSDSEEEEGEKKKKEEDVEVEVASAAAEKAPPPLSPAPPSSYIPIIPPSTSGTFRAEEAAGQREAWRRRSRSWSESSERSRRSVCSLSPTTPEQRWGGREQRGERRKKKKRRRDRSRENPRRSGSFCNPNRSIFPPMMSRCASSPYDSSADSTSPRDPSWELRFTQVSPLTSSVSSRSFSPLCSSPPRTPPTPSYSPKRLHHVDKPGGKRKYKSRHLNSSSKDPSWRPHSSRRRKKEKGRREVLRREKTGNSRRSREDRSPSVEIIYEGTLTSGTTQPPPRKRRRKRHRKTQPSSSPVIITLDSDSSHDGATRRSPSASSSPLSSQQTIDFSDIPPLPPLHAAGGGGATDPDVGELPVDILDRVSDGSESEAAGRSGATRPVRRSGSLENMEDSVSLLSDDQTAAEPIRASDTEAANQDQKEPAAEQNGPKPLNRTDPEESPSDRNLLQTILHDLNRIPSPRADLDSGSGFLSERRKQTQQNLQNSGCWLEEWTGSGPTPNICRQQNKESTSPIRTSSALKDSREAPPLLRRASPVRSSLRNTPPPLKHKDGGSPQRGATFPQNSGPRCSSGSDPTGQSSPVLVGLNQHAIPPISTLKNPLTKALMSSSGSDPFPALSLGSVAPSEPGPSRDRLKLTFSPDLCPRLSDLHPLHRSSTSGSPAGPPGLDAAGAVHLASWGVFSGLNSNYLFPSRSGSEPPAGGSRSDIQNLAADLLSLSGSAFNHMALAPPPSRFIPPNSNCSSQSQARSERFQSDPAPQNHGSFPQPVTDCRARFHPNGPAPQPEVQPPSDSSHFKAANRTLNPTADNPPSDPQSERCSSEVPPP